MTREMDKDKGKMSGAGQLARKWRGRVPLHRTNPASARGGSVLDAIKAAGGGDKEALLNEALQDCKGASAGTKTKWRRAAGVRA